MGECWVLLADYQVLGTGYFVWLLAPAASQKSHCWHPGPSIALQLIGSSSQVIRWGHAMAL